MLLLFVIQFNYSQQLESSKSKLNLYILSFDNLKDNPELYYLEDGLADYMVNNYRNSSDDGTERIDLIVSTIEEIKEESDYQDGKINLAILETLKRRKANLL